MVEPRVDKTEFRPFWRVHSHLAALVEAGRITGQEFETALLWRRWNEELGRQRVQRWDSIRIGQSLVPRVAAVRQLDAATQLRAAAEALGPQRTALLDWSIRDDLTWVRIGRRINLSDKTVIVRVVETLQALALWHAGRPVPPPPRTRPYNRPRSW